MNGSEKQIKWAQDIIASEKEIIERHLFNNRQRVALDGEKYPALKLMLAAQEACCEYVLSNIDKLDNAKEIIDNRAVRYYILRKGIRTMPKTEIVQEFLKQAQNDPSVNRNNIMSLLVG